MKWLSKHVDKDNRTFLIEYDQNVGYYLYVSDKDGDEIFDDLQDTLDWAKRSALDEFNVPLDSWQKVS